MYIFVQCDVQTNLGESIYMVYTLFGLMFLVVIGTAFFLNRDREEKKDEGWSPERYRSTPEYQYWFYKDKPYK